MRDHTVDIRYNAQSDFLPLLDRVKIHHPAVRRAVDQVILHEHTRVTGLAAQLRSLSPAATLDRGYAVVQTPDGTVVRSPDDTRTGELLRIRVTRGELAATVAPTAP